MQVGLQERLELWRRQGGQGAGDHPRFRPRLQSGQGRVVLWLTGDSAWCTVTDSGPGIPARYLQPPEVPEAFEVGGRGIWLAHQLCDEVTVATGPIGTTIGLRIVLPTRRTTPA